MRDLGFKSRSIKIDVSDLSEEARSSEDIIADSAAKRSGFASREAVERVTRTRRPGPVCDQAFVRAKVDVINRFKRFCNESGLNYGEALDELMRRAGM